MKYRNMIPVMMLAASILLGVSRGDVAVWRDDDPLPAFITDMPVSALPEADQKRLQAGISLPDEAALQRALEDYCS